MTAPDPPTLNYREYPQLHGDLFETVQSRGIFDDSKTFVDAVPTTEPNEIREAFAAAGELDDDGLRAFVGGNFDVPDAVTAGVDQPVGETMCEHVRNLWSHLIADADEGGRTWSTLLPLPNPYIKPGGRFREIYYWDTYFTALGLVRSGRVGLVEDMIDNFASLIDRFGFVPNGNRLYYCSRSQPPMFCQLLHLLAGERGREVVGEYLPRLRAEYGFWMAGSDDLSADDRAHRRVVRLEDGSVLNRYWDDYPAPRPEAYREDVAVAERCPNRDSRDVFRDLRASAESGWDFSSRWFADYERIETIRTTEVLPVDLNALLYGVERTLARWSDGVGNSGRVDSRYERGARDRAEAIERYHWDPDREFFFDFCWTESERTDAWTLAGVVPLYVGVATNSQADAVARTIEDRFLREGGVPATLRETGHQWDYPGGWAPLTWFAVVGLENYGHDELATEIARRWLDTTASVFRESGVMMEKYDVERTGAATELGEYVGQVGFGWTNGVTLALAEKYPIGQNG